MKTAACRGFGIPANPVHGCRCACQCAYDGQGHDAPRLGESGIPVAKGFVATSADQAQEILDTLGGDIVVKPSGEGSSVGVFKLKGATVDEVRQALTEALRFDAKVLVEERWFGRELTIAVLGASFADHRNQAPEGNYD